MLKAIHAQESRERALEKTRSVIAEFKRQRVTKAAELVEENIGDTLTYDRFPDSHWIKLRTNNLLERITREIRRLILPPLFPHC